MPIKKRSKGIYGFFPLMHRNASGRKLEQFHQGQCAVVRETKTEEVCRIHKFLDNLKNICQIKLKFYHKPVRSCSILSKKSDFMQTVAFRKCLNEFMIWRFDE